MPSVSSDSVKVSVRMPKVLLKKIFRLYPKEGISDLVRHLVEKEIHREKSFKAHMKLYGRFKPEDFDESLL